MPAGRGRARPKPARRRAWSRRALVEKAADRTGEQHDGGEFTNDDADGNGYEGTPDDAGPAGRRAAGDRAAHRADQQTEDERQRHDDGHRHVPRFRDGESGYEPGQCRTEQYHNAGDHMRGPFVALTQLTPFSTAEPRQRFSNSVGRHGNSKHLQDLYQRDRGEPTHFGQAEFDSPISRITPVRMPEFSHGPGAGSERSGTKDPPRRPPHTCRHDKLESRWVRCADRGDARRLLIDSLDHGSEHVGQPRYAHINGG